MTIGVGTDILSINRLENSMEDEVFLSAVYTNAERIEAAEREKPLTYFATRYAAKEAVFKCFGQVSGEIRLNEIEVLAGENGKPFVTLTGKCLEHARILCISRIELSLSYDGGFALAFAVALS